MGIFGSKTVKNDDFRVESGEVGLNALLDEFRDGAKIFQKNWEWFFSDFGTVKPFVDGMKV